MLNLFKKKTSKEAKENIQKLDKNQLRKVIGGAETLGHEAAHVKQESTTTKL